MSSRLYVSLKNRNSPFGLTERAADWSCHSTKSQKDENKGIDLHFDLDTPFEGSFRSTVCERILGNLEGQTGLYSQLATVDGAYG